MVTPASSSTAPVRRPRPAYHLLIAALLSGLALLMPPPALAAGIVVTTANEGIAPSDGCSLREAITNATAGNQSGSAECNAGSGNDIITFAGDYTITLASALPDLSTNLTIDGASHSISISGNNAVRVFWVNASGVVILSSLSIIDGNSPDLNGGGGIFNIGTLTISDSTVSGNSADSPGGGIVNFLGTLTISNSTFSGNSTNSIGGGIQNSGTLTISNSTFSTNSSTSSGGGIDGSGGTTLTISNSTFSGNSAPVGGGVANRGGTLHLRNSLIANSPSGGDCFNTGTLATNLNNLIEDGSCGAALSGDPLLSPQGSYGGATQTFALLPGSPTIDAGAACSAADQRGITRPTSCDIGAFESRGFSLGSLSGTPQSAAIMSAFASPLGLTVSSSFGEPVGPGGQITFTAPSSGASVTFAPTSSASTDAGGAVSQPIIANGVVGSYSVTATSRGAASPVSFSLTNQRVLLYLPLIAHPISIAQNLVSDSSERLQ
jgi:hypothetical protein